jgi:hypothetical protein
MWAIPVITTIAWPLCCIDGWKNRARNELNGIVIRTTIVCILGGCSWNRGRARDTVSLCTVSRWWHEYDPSGNPCSNIECCCWSSKMTMFVFLTSWNDYYEIWSKATVRKRNTQSDPIGEDSHLGIWWNLTQVSWLWTPTTWCWYHSRVIYLKLHIYAQPMVYIPQRELSPSRRRFVWYLVTPTRTLVIERL